MDSDICSYSFRHQQCIQTASFVGRNSINYLLYNWAPETFCLLKINKILKKMIVK